MIGIKIEMPTYCYDCPCHNGENGQCNVTGEYTSDKRPFDCPLCDVGEVKHGKWKITNHRDVCGLYFEYECSNCKIGFYANPTYHELGGHNYCPHCGAKMDLEEENRA